MTYRIISDAIILTKEDAQSFATDCETLIGIKFTVIDDDAPTVTIEDEIAERKQMLDIIQPLYGIAPVVSVILGPAHKDYVPK